jgi:putative nucleotidyltransferase with HDIG domain
VTRLTLLNEISNALHSVLDLKELLRFLISAIACELDAERASLMLIDPNRDEMTIEASVGMDDDLSKIVRVRIGEGISGWVAQHGEPLFVDDISRDQRFPKSADRAYGSDSFISAPLFLSVPIKLKKEVIGVININNKKGGGCFTANDTQLVTTLAGQAALSIENARMLEKLRRNNQELKETHFETISALAGALEAKDAVSGDHSERLLRYAMDVAHHLGLNECERELLRYAAVLHDIGKIGIPEGILQKPGKLTPDEYEQIKEHPRIGADLIRTVKFLAAVAPIILAHHEHYDGTGYPAGLAGEDIPIQARIVAALDAFDAMTSERPYRPAPGPEWAVQELRKFSGSQFDPKVVQALLSVLENKQANQED